MTKSLSAKYKNDEFDLLEADLETLKIFKGTVLDLTLMVGDEAHHFVTGGPDDEQQWNTIRSLLPPSLHHLQSDWDAIESNLAAPLRDGALLPDFTLEGPLDLHIILPPSSSHLGLGPMLWLPHAVEVGQLRRVLLRKGAAIVVRGAKKIALRHSINLPTVSLSEFVEFAVEDKARKNAAGLMHLSQGLREMALNSTNNNNTISPAVVAFDVEFLKDSGVLLAAASAQGALQRLGVRRLSDDGVIELTPKGVLTSESSRALTMPPASPFVWPLRSSIPETIEAYETLLREVLSRQVFAGGGGGGGGGSGRRKGRRLRLVDDLPLKLHRSTAEAVLLMQIELTVVQKQKQKSQLDESNSSSGREGEGYQQPPTPTELLKQSLEGGNEKSGSSGSSGGGRREVWSAVVKVEGSAREGLRFTPIRVKLVERVSEKTVSFAPEALPQLMNLGGGMNASSLVMRGVFGGGGDGSGEL